MTTRIPVSCPAQSACVVAIDALTSPVEMGRLGFGRLHS